MTKKMLHAEWSMSIDEAIDAEAEAQAICMETKDFHRAYGLTFGPDGKIYAVSFFGSPSDKDRILTFDPATGASKASSPTTSTPSRRGRRRTARPSSPATPTWPTSCAASSATATPSSGWRSP